MMWFLPLQTKTKMAIFHQNLNKIGGVETKILQKIEMKEKKCGQHSSIVMLLSK